MENDTFTRADILPTLKKAWNNMFKSENVRSAMEKTLSFDWVVDNAEADRVAAPAAALTHQEMVDRAIAAAQAHPQVTVEEALKQTPDSDQFCELLLSTAINNPEALDGVDLLALLKQAIKNTVTAIPGAAMLFIKVMCGYV